MPLTHLNEENQPKIVDIGDKETTERIALASGRISMNKEAYDAIVNHCVKKGPVLQTAIIAGIMGAKKRQASSFPCAIQSCSMGWILIF
ncbi:hypothetical protein BTM391_02610 [Helicobacter pylori]